MATAPAWAVLVATIKAVAGAAPSRDAAPLDAVMDRLVERYRVG